MRIHLALAVLGMGVLAGWASGASAQNVQQSSQAAWYASESFRLQHGRCGTDIMRIPPNPALKDIMASDCSSTFTNPDPVYDPSEIFRIPVVVHIIQHRDGRGAISDQLVQSQIDILNEDFRALAGTPGAPGLDTGIEFFLATEDPDGFSTTGITRSTRTQWFNDSGNYKSSLAWDPNLYLNIYTNTAGGFLGYVESLPSDDNGFHVGKAQDGVVVHWEAFGRNSPGGPPYDQGRTLTHEVGHYLGLFHPFEDLGQDTDQCISADSPDCYSNGDLICDTGVSNEPQFGCPNTDPMQCGDVDAIENYMNYTDDACMFLFSQEQIRRMRCTLETWRSCLPIDGRPEGEVCSNNGVDKIPLVCGVIPSGKGSGIASELITMLFLFMILLGLAQKQQKDH